VVRVKVCGITQPADVVAAAAAGVDAFGINFVGGPRQLDVAAAARVLDAAPPMCTPVALVDVSRGDVPPDLLELLGHYWVDHLQLYGTVRPETVARLRADGFKPILVQHVQAESFPNDTARVLAEMTAAQPSAVLLDAHVEGVQGGTGVTADWDAIASAGEAGALKTWPPVILAGGLNPDNVAGAVRRTKPWAVDVSSGVESGVGVKSLEMMTRFVANVRQADQAG
jgi:phosphoribosylanthranilate isomerase